MQLLIQYMLSACNVTPVVVGRQVDIHITGQPCVFVPDHGRSRTQIHFGSLAQRYLGTARSHDQDCPERVEIVAIVLEIADVDRVPLPPLDRSGDVFAPDAGRDRKLDIIDGQAVARRGVAVDDDVYIEPLRHSFCKYRPSSFDRRQDLFDLRTDPLDFIDVWTLYLDSHRSFDAGQLH